MKSKLYDEPENPFEQEFARLRKEIEAGLRYCRQIVKFLNYEIEIVDNISFMWQFKDIFVDELYRFESDSIAPRIFDCGANVGTSCLYFKSLFPHARISAFEADPRIADVLQNNLVRNGCADIEVLPKAIWVHDGAVEFGCEGADAGSIHSDSEKISIAAVRLREMIRQEERLDFLKLDIEGAETAVLADCADVLFRVERMFIEYHSWVKLDQTLDVVLKLLRSNRFRYHLSPIAARKSPFVNRALDLPMDLQVNIFAYRL
ncbi:MAG: FkbM family methyltransferase [Desulfobacteraceae bacterium]|nr:FkbM family methyltransferase [Desulfobacteraceae bacterium]